MHHESDSYNLFVSQVIDYLAFKCMKHDVDFFNCYTVLSKSIIGLSEWTSPHRCYEFVQEFFRILQEFEGEVPLAWVREIAHGKIPIKIHGDQAFRSLI